MVLISPVFALALLTDNLCEAGFILVVLDLVTRYCNLIAAVASNRLVGASFTVLFNHRDVQIFATSVFAISEGSLTALLDVLFKTAH